MLIVEFGELKPHIRRLRFAPPDLQKDDPDGPSCKVFDAECQL
jgi:hypothetical protein